MSKLRQPVEFTDVAIIGAGPAGSVAAAILARDGFSVTMLEKQWFPRHVIGESLLPRCLDLLEQAGLLDAVKARNYIPKHAAMFYWVEKSHRFVFADSLPGDWTMAYQVPRDDFDQTLATAARSMGADVRFGLEVTDITFQEDGATLNTHQAEGDISRELKARFVLDCSGPARVLSKILNLEVPADIMARSAYYTHVEGDIRDEGEAEGDIWVVSHENGAWIWVIPFSNGRTSVGVVAEQAIFDRYPGSDSDKMWAMLRSEPNCARRLLNAKPVMATKRLNAWTTITNQLSGHNWAVAGNAGDFLDPVFSSGVMFALESGTLSARLASRQLNGETVDWKTEYEAHMHKAIGVFRTFVKAWYTGQLSRIFTSPVKPESSVKSICSILGGNVLNELNPLVSGDTQACLDRMERGAKMLAANRG